MHRAPRLRLISFVVASICCLAIVYLWVNRAGLWHLELMLVPIAPFAFLALAGGLTNSKMVDRGSLVILLFFCGFLAFRLIYPILRHSGDEWLLLSLVYIGAWELIIASLAVGILFAVDQRRIRRSS